MKFTLSQHKCIETLTELTDLSMTLADWSRIFVTVHTELSRASYLWLCILRLFVVVAVPILQEDLLVLYFVRCKISQDKVAVQGVFVDDPSPPSKARCLSLCHSVAFSMPYAASNFAIF